MLMSRNPYQCLRSPLETRGILVSHMSRLCLVLPGGSGCISTIRLKERLQ